MSSINFWISPDKEIFCLEYTQKEKKNITKPEERKNTNKTIEKVKSNINKHVEGNTPPTK